MRNGEGKVSSNRTTTHSFIVHQLPSRYSEQFFPQSPDTRTAVPSYFATVPQSFIIVSFAESVRCPDVSIFLLSRLFRGHFTVPLFLPLQSCSIFVSRLLTSMSYSIVREPFPEPSRSILYVASHFFGTGSYKWDFVNSMLRYLS